MKKFKVILLAGLVVGISAVFYGFNKNYDQEYNEEVIKKISDIRENGDDVTKEFIDLLLSHEDQAEIKYYHIFSDDGSIDYMHIQGRDLDKGIDIDGRYDQNSGVIYISKNDDRYWLDLGKNIYHKDKRSDNDIDNSIAANELTFGQREVYMALGESYRKVEKIDKGYKLVIDDDLNFGYDIYDENGYLLESYLENSEGNIYTIFEKSTDDIEGVFNYYLSMIENMTYTDDIADIK